MAKRHVFRKLTAKQEAAIEGRVVEILHASRDAMRNRGEDTTKIAFSTQCSWWGEAAGILRALETLGYGYYGSSNLNAVEERKSDNPKANLSWWLRNLESQVLEEENFLGNNRCAWCLKKYGKDAKSILEKEEK